MGQGLSWAYTCDHTCACRHSPVQVRGRGGSLREFGALDRNVHLRTSTCTRHYLSCHLQSIKCVRSSLHVVRKLGNQPGDTCCMQFKHSKDDEQGYSGDQNSQISF